MLTDDQELNYMTTLNANAKLPTLPGEPAKKPDVTLKNPPSAVWHFGVSWVPLKDEKIQCTLWDNMLSLKRLCCCWGLFHAEERWCQKNQKNHIW